MADVKKAAKTAAEYAAFGPLANDTIRKGAANALGIGSADTGEITESLSEAKDRRSLYADQLAGYMGEDAPTVNASTTTGAQISGPAYVTAAQGGPAVEAQAALVGAVPEVERQEIAPTERITAERIQGQYIRPAEEAEAERIQAAQMGSAERARAQQISAAQISPMERVQAAQVGGPQEEMRARQLALTDQIQAAMLGKAPSVAQAQYERNLADVTANQFGQAAQARGAARAALMAQAMRSGGEAAQKAALDAALIRANETTQARGQMTGLLEGARGQDISLGTTNAQLQQQAALSNQGAANTAALEQARLAQQASLANQSTSTQVDLANAAATNELKRAQAQIDQQAALANQSTAADISKTNAAATNAQTLEQAKLMQQAALANQSAGNTAAAANAAAANDRASQQAHLNVNVDTGNVSRAVDVAKTNAENTQQTNVVNAAAQNTVNSQNTQNQQQANVTNAGATNEVNATNAQLSQKTGEFNATQTQQAAKDTGQMALQGRQQTEQEKQGLRTAQSDAADQAIKAEGAISDLKADEQKRRAAFTGKVLDAAGSLAAMSDRRSKRDIEYLDRMSESMSKREPEDEMQEFLESLRPATFRYKDPDEDGAAPGQRWGVIAQDLERTPAGDSIVLDTPRGKMIDTAQAVPLLMGALAKMREEMDRMRRAR